MVPVDLRSIVLSAMYSASAMQTVAWLHPKFWCINELQHNSEVFWSDIDRYAGFAEQYSISNPIESQ
jgi:hypothetical protein